MQVPHPLTSNPSTPPQSAKATSDAITSVPPAASMESTSTTPITSTNQMENHGDQGNHGDQSERDCMENNAKSDERDRVDGCDTTSSYDTTSSCPTVESREWIEISAPEPLESAPLSTYQEFVLRAKRNGSEGFVDLGHGLVLAAKGGWQLLCSAGLWSWIGVLRLPEWLRSFRHTPSVADDDATELDPATLEPLPTLASNAATLTIYGVPLRLAAVIVAPAGNQRKLASYAELLESFELAVPGLARVLKTHKPKIVPWGSQLSTCGFASKFHANVPLPEANELSANSTQEYGLQNGSHWCSVVGPMRRGEQTLLVGWVLHCETLTTVGRCVAETPQQWRTFCAIR